MALIAVGNMVEAACKVYEALKEKGKEITLVNARFIKPLDETMLINLAGEHQVIFTLEEQLFQGGYGQAVSSFYMRNHMNQIRVENIAIEDTFVEHGAVEALRRLLGLDAESVLQRIERYL